MVSFLREYGLLNFGDLILIFVLVITLLFFLFRTGLYLYFKQFGIVDHAKIVAYDKVPVLKNRSKYGEYVDTYQYTFEYLDQKGVAHRGVLKKLFLTGRYEIGDEIQVRYLKNKPKSVRVYSSGDWFRFEFIALMIALVLFLIIFTKTVI